MRCGDSESISKLQLSNESRNTTRDEGINVVLTDVKCRIQEAIGMDILCDASRYQSPNWAMKAEMLLVMNVFTITINATPRSNKGENLTSSGPPSGIFRVYLQVLAHWYWRY